MPEITLYGRKSSVNVQKVVWALGELSLDFEHIQVGGKFGGTQEPSYLAMNPNGLVPTLRDGDLTLWESAAIVRYLAAEYGAGSLWPEEAKLRALSDQWADFTAARFQPAWLSLFSVIIRVRPDERDYEVIAKVGAETRACLDIMCQRLEKAPFLGGEVLTYADILAGASLFRLATMEDVPFELPEPVKAWHERLLQRDAFVRGVNVSYDELRAV